MQKSDKMLDFNQTMKRGWFVVLMFSFCCRMTAEATPAGWSDASKCTFKVLKKSGNRQPPVVIRAGESSSRRSDANPSASAGTASKPDADPSYEIDSFCGYKFGGDYRGSNQSVGGRLSSPDTVRLRMERPFRNFKIAILNHGKAGMQRITLMYCDETHVMNDEDLADEVEAVKGVLEKKYGIKFVNSTAQRGKMLFSVSKINNLIRLEVTNRGVVHRGQNFGANGGADVL